MHQRSFIQVMIADDHSLFTDGLAEIIDSIPRFTVIAKVNSGKLLLQALNSQSPDLILLDISMPLMDGMETAIAIRQKLPSVKIVFISMHYNERIKSFMARNSINGFIIKNANASDLKDALPKIIAGQNMIIPPLQSAAHHAVTASRQDELIQKYKLTNTEITVIKLITNGYSSKMIATKNELSLLTVETHRKNIMRKLDAKNVAEVVAWAVENGLHR